MLFIPNKKAAKQIQQKRNAQEMEKAHREAVKHLVVGGSYEMEEEDMLVWSSLGTLMLANNKEK